MATEAQIEANRRNARKSTGPRTEEGKKQSRLNALDHGCRANMLVLPSEDSAEFENKSRAWKLCLRPRNPAEEFLVEKLVGLAWQSDRIDQAHTARLTRRMYHGTFEEDHRIDEQVIELSQKLFRNASGPRALQLQHKAGEPIQDGKPVRISDDSVDEDHPSRLVHRLHATGAGCQWLLGQWAKLSDLLEQGVPWLAPDKLKAVRLLGRHPIDAFDFVDVAGVYLASHTLLNQGGQPFQEIMNELSPDQPEPVVANVAVPAEEATLEPGPTIEANLARENAPNEPNSSVQSLSNDRRDGHKEVRIDTPHVARGAGGAAITGKRPIHPALDRLLTGQQSTLMNLSPIFGEKL